MIGLEKAHIFKRTQRLWFKQVKVKILSTTVCSFIVFGGKCLVVGVTQPVHRNTLLHHEKRDD